ncbi:hypothetical protein RclHR1_00230021 [Rhizophagus clarus]|uniref:Transmembrane protein n=1 Tax=Rhizophagus clarus TaxID=94130 RepID=A0A2Z6QUZ3_9GLOM|nr:hypothetical protein RclHR1_00230021 [Rhizophagus clarus]GES72925.1 hypothetical protein GLOIN_2v1727228 [Rhizophagus clarus]
MKSFSFFVFLNLLILFVYAQNQAIPSTTSSTCEQYFTLNSTTSCTPCQQAIFKTQQLPTAKCNIIFILASNMLGPPTPNSLRDDIDKTCAAEATNGCNESDAKSAYTEVDKACDAEINLYLSVQGTDKENTPPYSNEVDIGSSASSIIFANYLAIPFIKSLCTKVGGEYCIVKSFEQTNSSDPLDLTQCDDCTKQSYDNLKSFQSSHPLDTPNLQRIMADSTTKEIQAFEQKCPNLAKSDAQKLTSQFYNYPRIILIGLIGFIYVTFM